MVISTGMTLAQNRSLAPPEARPEYYAVLRDITRMLTSLHLGLAERRVDSIALAMGPVPFRVDAPPRPWRVGDDETYFDACRLGFLHTSHAVHATLTREHDSWFSPTVAPYIDEYFQDRVAAARGFTRTGALQPLFGSINGGYATVTRMAETGVALGLTEEAIMDRAMRASRVTLERQEALDDRIDADATILKDGAAFRTLLADFGYATAIGCPARHTESADCRAWLARHDLPRRCSTPIRESLSAILSNYQSVQP